MRAQSTLSQVVALLQEAGPGVRVTLHDLRERAPWLDKNRTSASLAILTTPRYELLRRTDEKGAFGVRVYETLPAIVEVEWRALGEPRRYAHRGHRASPEAEAAPVDHDVVDDALTRASVLVDDRAYDEAMDAVRAAYYELKKGRTR